MTITATPWTAIAMFLDVKNIRDMMCSLIRYIIEVDVCKRGELLVVSERLKK